MTLVLELRRRWPLACALIPVLGICVLSAPATAQVGPGSELFQIGTPGAATVVGNADLPGLDWADLFDKHGRTTELAAAGSLVLFDQDYVSKGEGFEGSAAAGHGLFNNGIAESDHDLSNAYFYETTNASGEAHLFIAFERLATGDSKVWFELNQDRQSMGRGGYTKNVPWTVDGERTVGDLGVALEFSASHIAGVLVQAWDGSSWRTLTELGGEGCGDGDNFCIATNVAAIEGGPWHVKGNGNAGGGKGKGKGNANKGDLEAQTFIEMGVNLGALLGANPEYATAQAWTPQDMMLCHLWGAR